MKYASVKGRIIGLDAAYANATMYISMIVPTCISHFCLLTRALYLEGAACNMYVAPKEIHQGREGRGAVAASTGSWAMRRVDRDALGNTAGYAGHAKLLMRGVSCKHAWHTSRPYRTECGHTAATRSRLCRTSAMA